MGQTLPCRVARQLRCRDEPSAGDGRIWQHLRHRGSTRVSWVATASQRECGAGHGGAGGVWWVDLFGAGHDAGWGADGDPFHAANPRVIVKLNYAGSADLAAQILQGARVDIVATANTSTMNTVTTAGLVDGPPTVFATNQLQIVVGTGNPKGITSGPSPVSIAAMCFYDHRITRDLRASLSPRSDPQELMCGVDCGQQQAGGRPDLTQEDETS